MNKYTQEHYEALSLNYRLTRNMMSQADQEQMKAKLDAIYSDIKREQIQEEFLSGQFIDTQTFLSLLGWYNINYGIHGLWIQSEIQSVAVGSYTSTRKLPKAKDLQLCNLTHKLHMILSVKI